MWWLLEITIGNKRKGEMKGENKKGKGKKKKKGGERKKLKRNKTTHKNMKHVQD